MESTPDLWIHKYKPDEFSDLISNPYSISRIENWLKLFNTNKKAKFDEAEKKKKKELKIKPKKKKFQPKSSLIVIGNHGVGKTISVEVLLESMNYDVQRINFSNIKNTKDIDAFVDRYLSNSNVIGMINDEKSQKFAVVVDEIESISSNNEKKFILDLQRKNNADWMFPLILISNNKHSKLLSDIRKECLEIPFKDPTRDNMMAILKKICKNENLQIKDFETANLIIDHSQSDIRRLVYTLQDLFYEYGSSTKIGTFEFSSYLSNSKTKDSNDDIYVATEELFTNFKSIDYALRWYETDKVLTPLMIHSNYVDQVILTDALDTTKKTQFAQLEQVSKIAEMLSFGDVVENYIYGDQNWDVHDIHGFFSCIGPSHLMNETVKKNTKDNIFVKKRIKDLHGEFNKFVEASSKYIEKKKKVKKPIAIESMNLLLETIVYFKTKVWLYKFLKVYDKRRDKINDLIEQLQKNIEKKENSMNYPDELLGYLKDVYVGLCGTLKRNFIKSPVHPDMEFPIDLNKTSIKKINKRNINNASKCFNKIGIEDYIYINNIVRYLIKYNKISECKELFRGYGAKLIHIEALLKIDKISSDKSLLTNKQKKEFSSYLEDK